MFSDLQFGRKKKHFAVYDAGHLQGLRASSWGAQRAWQFASAAALLYQL